MAEVAAIILAAGRASRFGAGLEDSKASAELAGTPLVRHVAATALASRAAPVLVVTGHAAARVGAALDGLDVTIVHNPDFATGMASSLKAGIAALPAPVTGALVLLADMPLVAATTLDRLIAVFLEAGAAGRAPAAVIPVREGRKGNPVLIGRALFGELAALDGDEGARKLLARPGFSPLLCPVDDPGIEIDIDTRDALLALDRR